MKQYSRENGEIGYEFPAFTGDWTLKVHPQAAYSGVWLASGNGIGHDHLGPNMNRKEVKKLVKVLKKFLKESRCRKDSI